MFPAATQRNRVKRRLRAFLQKKTLLSGVYSFYCKDPRLTDIGFSELTSLLERALQKVATNQ